jgi:glucarate dehydratase
MHITEMVVTPIAIGDPPVLNAAGLHASFALRTVVEIVASNGLTGLAEVPGGAKIEAALCRARATVIGCDPLNPRSWQGKLADLFKEQPDAISVGTPWDHRPFLQVQSALDVACLDIQGKAYGAPVATLLGGIMRERVPFAAYLFYKHAGAGGDWGFGIDSSATGWPAVRQAAALDPAGIVAQAEAMVAEFGFQSIKLKGGVFAPEEEIAALLALRECFGPNVPLRYDPNAVWTVETAIRVGRQLESVLEYLEDPVFGQPDMAKVRREVSIPLATNMCTTSFRDLPESARVGSEDIILADHHFWGGLRPAMDLAAHCRTFGLGLSMHSNNHAGISLAAMTQLGAAIPNLSFALDTHYPWQSDEIIAGGRLKIEEGCVQLPSGPGLGVELDRPALARAHAAYLRCGLRERNDELEMQKKSPGWKFRPNRW